MTACASIQSGISCAGGTALRPPPCRKWLNAGVAPAEVAKRADNSVEVLLRRYAGCLDNQEDAVNRQIEEALDEADLAPEEG